MFAGFEAARIDTGAGPINLRHGGEGPPLLLLHGYPQTHAMWHAVAPALAEDRHVVCPDLRGYGDSATPSSAPDHAPYAKRASAGDMVEVMAALGCERFDVAGHDRGGRVAHRLALDHPDRVRRLCVMDIVPTRHVFMTADRFMAAAYYHWFFLIQPGGLPERMIGADPSWYLQEKLRRWAAPGAVFDDAAVAEYVRCFDADTIHASCEDYRAAASIDLEHDQADHGRRLECPLLVLWGAKGFVNRQYDVPAVWREYASTVEGGTLECGHFLPEEDPAGVTRALCRFFAA